MTLTQRALVRVLLVVLVTVLGLMVTAPQDPPLLVTPATAPGAVPVIYNAGETP